MYIEAKEGKSGKWYYTLNANNDKVLCTSEMYAKKWNAVRAAKKLWMDITKNGKDCEIHVPT